MAQHFDVLVIGAGLSGVAAGYYLQTRCPDHSYAILEMRGAIGGTWDLFRYPGIRCDSDMFTLSYPFRPWPRDQIIAGGGDICEYIQATAREFGIDRQIRFHHEVTAASWSSASARWTVTVKRRDTGETVEYVAKFVISCSGYYDYQNPYVPEFPGVEQYTGEFVHPQLWPEDTDYTDKRVVIIGSGATAVTLLPVMAKRAAKATMLQRSPTYYISWPSTDKLAALARKLLPESLARELARNKNILTMAAFYSFCRAFPGAARRLLVDQVRRLLGDDYDVDTHFSPRYDPWDERMCLVPDGDLFAALRAGTAEIVTDHIDTFTQSGIRLTSGRELEADLVVSATGFNFRLLGGVTATLDGEPVAVNDKIFYRGTMFDELPNFAVIVGYTNASWTLKVELSLEWVCRVLEHMRATGNDVVVPHLRDPAIEREPLSDLTSGYIKRAGDKIPSAGSKQPWRMYRNYFLDRVVLRRAPLEDGVLEFSRARAEGPQAATPVAAAG